MKIGKTIGIGCFHFGIKIQIPFKFTGQEYIKELEKCLERIPNIENLQIETSESFIGASEEITQSLPELNKNGYFPSLGYYAQISFNIHLPYKIQADLSKTNEKYLNTFTENFLIIIVYSWHFPVAIVEPINPSDRSDASKAVSIIWKFLKNEINNKSKENFIKFEMLGPSPFHLDINILPIPSKNTKNKRIVNTEYHSRRGYDLMFLYYDTSILGNPDAALSYIFYSLVDEFGLYYKYQQIKVKRALDWNEIQHLIKRFKNIKELNFFRRMLFRLFQKSSIISDITNKIIDFESGHLLDNNYLNREIAEQYREEDYYFKEPIEKELFDDYDYPVSQTKELLKFIESRRVKSLELMIGLISAFIGGAIGAILTILLQ